MHKLNVAVIAGTLALAAVLGTTAALRTVSLGAASTRASDAAVAKRTRQLDAFSARLQAALTQKPPPLPPIPKAPSTSSVAASAQGGAATSGAPEQTVVYRRPAPIVVVQHRSHEDDGVGREAGEGRESGGGDD